METYNHKKIFIVLKIPYIYVNIQYDFVTFIDNFSISNIAIFFSNMGTVVIII